MRNLAVFLVLLLLPSPLWAGLYYSGEQFAELPAQWRGFLLDQRLLRNLALPPKASTPTTPLRTRYEAAARQLEETSRQRSLRAEEVADLGAVYVRLGEPAKAITLLRQAQRDYPSQFRILANLGTAWQLQGDLAQAAACLEQAVRLAPGKLQKAEAYHLKLVRFRATHSGQDLDDLFGVRFGDETGTYAPGQLAAVERRKLPAEATALVQQLALWLPADGRLLWQLAELANAQGDVRIAAAMMDGCVTEFGLHAPELRRHRQILREAADALAARGSAEDRGAKPAHTGHVSLFRPRSPRPLLNLQEAVKLPPISLTGINPLPWSVLAETTVNRQFKPTFPKYLQELQGKQVALTGFMQPLAEELELGSFLLIEYPVGCWYCEMPEITGIVHVELPPGQTATFTRGQVKVTGSLSLNATDPENFLFTLKEAQVAGVD